MKEITVHLQSPSRYERIEGVSSFVGHDMSGSFGILPGHERMITVVSPGIARLEVGRTRVEYLGLPESVLYFVDDQLFINADKYLKDISYTSLSQLLSVQLRVEQEARLEMRETIRRMEETLLKQLIRAPGERLL